MAGLNGLSLRCSIQEPRVLCREAKRKPRFGKFALPTFISPETWSLSATPPTSDHHWANLCPAPTTTAALSSQKANKLAICNDKQTLMNLGARLVLTFIDHKTGWLLLPHTQAKAGLGRAARSILEREVEWGLQAPSPGSQVHLMHRRSAGILAVEPSSAISRKSWGGGRESWFSTHRHWAGQG